MFFECSEELDLSSEKFIQGFFIVLLTLLAVGGNIFVELLFRYLDGKLAFELVALCLVILYGFMILVALVAASMVKKI